VGILLYVCGNFARVKIETVVREVLPMLGVSLILLVLITVFPQIAIWLPTAVLK
jgi:C4-dicarboxylate transporter DctM subunit